MSEKKSTINIKLIREVASVLKESDLGEIEIQINDLKLRISNSTMIKYQDPLHNHYMQSTHPSSICGIETSATHQLQIEESARLQKQILSPMVGTAYAAPSPEAKPFVTIGQFIEEGQTLLIIEAMKTMNHIPAPRSGKVTAIHFQNGQPVEFSEPLISME